MRRIRITLSEEKSGWKFIRQDWDTVVNHGFYGGKSEQRSKRIYSNPSDILNLLAVEQEETEKMCCGETPGTVLSPTIGEEREMKGFSTGELLPNK